MTMEKTTMNEYVSPIKNGDFPASHVGFQGGYMHTKGCRCGVSPPLCKVKQSATMPS